MTGLSALQLGGESHRGEEPRRELPPGIKIPEIFRREEDFMELLYQNLRSFTPLQCLEYAERLLDFLEGQYDDALRQLLGSRNTSIHQKTYSVNNGKLQRKVKETIQRLTEFTDAPIEELLMFYMQRLDDIMRPYADKSLYYPGEMDDVRRYLEKAESGIEQGSVPQTRFDEVRSRAVLLSRKRSLELFEKYKSLPDEKRTTPYPGELSALQVLHAYRDAFKYEENREPLEKDRLHFEYYISAPIVLSIKQLADRVIQRMQKLMRKGLGIRK